MVTQSKLSSANGRHSALASDEAHVAHRPRSSSRSRPDVEHRGVDVGEHDQARCADLLRHAGGQVAGAAGDVERRLPGRSPVCDSVKRFHSRCTPADIRSFIRSYLAATESNTARTRRAFSAAGTCS